SLKSRDAEERLLAARGLGADPEALEAAEAIAVIESVPHELRMRALVQLAFHAPNDMLEPILDACISSSAPEVSAEAVRILVEKKLPSARERLLKVLELFAQDPLPLVAAAEGSRSIAREGDVEIEAALISLLVCDDGRVRIEATKSLAELGTIRA